MKKLNHVIKILIVIAVMASVGIFKSKETYAEVDINQIISAGNSWVEEGQKSAEDFALDLAGIGQILVSIGVVVLLIAGAIMAFQWVTATPDKQAKLKTQLIGLVISAVVIFGAVGIWNLVRNVGKDIENNIGQTTTNYVTMVADK